MSCFCFAADDRQDALYVNLYGAGEVWAHVALTREHIDRKGRYRSYRYDLKNISAWTEEQKRRQLKKPHCWSRTPRGPWVYQGRVEAQAYTRQMLGRVMIGRVRDVRRFERVMRRTPVYQHYPEGDGPYQFNCQKWLAGALGTLGNSGALAPGAVTDWQRIREEANMRLEQRRWERRWVASSPQYPAYFVPEWDMTKFA